MNGMIGKIARQIFGQEVVTQVSEVIKKFRTSGKNNGKAANMILQQIRFFLGVFMNV